MNNVVMGKAGFNILCYQNFEYTHFGTFFKAAFYGSNRSFWRKPHLRKKSFFNAFWTLSEIFLAFYPNFFCRFVKTCILRVQCNSLRKQSFWKETIYFSSFSDFEQKSFELLAQILLQGCQNYILLFLGIILKKLNFLKFFLLLGQWAESCLYFCRKFFGGFTKTAFYMSRGTFCGRWFFSKKL